MLQLHHHHYHHHHHRHPNQRLQSSSPPFQAHWSSIQQPTLNYRVIISASWLLSLTPPSASIFWNIYLEDGLPEKKEKEARERGQRYTMGESGCGEGCRDDCGSDLRLTIHYNVRYNVFTMYIRYNVRSVYV